MNAETTLDKFKKFMKDNKQHLYESAIDASEIRSDDEWMKEEAEEEEETIPARPHKKRVPESEEDEDE